MTSGSPRTVGVKNRCVIYIGNDFTIRKGTVHIVKMEEKNKGP